VGLTVLNVPSCGSSGASASDPEITSIKFSDPEVTSSADHSSLCII
jgi:hypothetical protein